VLAKNSSLVLSEQRIECCLRGILLIVKVPLLRDQNNARFNV